MKGNSVNICLAVETRSTNFHVTKCWVLAQLRKVWVFYCSVICVKRKIRFRDFAGDK